MKRKILLSAAALLILLVLICPVPQSVYNRLTLALSDFLHFPLALLLFWIVRGMGSSRGPAAVIVLVVLAGIECLQPFWGRSASAADFSYAALGIIAALLLTRAPKMKAAFLLLCVLALLPACSVLWDQCAARRAFPRLGSFECLLEKGRWTLNGVSMNRVSSHNTHRRFSAEIRVSESDFPYPGLFLEDMPRDWRGAEALLFDIFWPAGVSREVCVRIDDQKGNPSYANRFQKSFVLQPGMNRIRIDCEEFGWTSGGAMMNLSRVMRMGLFYFNAEKDEVFYMDNVRLLKGEQ